MIDITTPLMFTTADVCDENVFEPTVAKVVHADQGPERLVAVQYKLSFGAVTFFSMRILGHFASQNLRFHVKRSLGEQKSEQRATYPN